MSALALAWRAVRAWHYVALASKHSRRQARALALGDAEGTDWHEVQEMRCWQRASDLRRGLA